jgi:PAS domain S-box-containing protein
VTVRPCSLVFCATSPSARKPTGLEQSERLLQTVADHLTAVIWVKDLDGRYLLINGSYQKLFDLPRERLSDAPISISSAPSRRIFRAVDREALAARGGAEEETVSGADGRITLLSVKCPV